LNSTVASVDTAPAAEAGPLAFLAHGGEAARLVREFDWSATPLGPIDRWSPTLRIVVRFILASRFPHLLWWGPDYVQIYNDAYSPILGTKHPHEAMGRPFRECWHEVYDVLGPLVDTPFNGGAPTYVDDIELVVHRHGFPEESHFTIAYSPVPDDTAPRGIGGVLADVMEITEKVIGERRLTILSELATQLAAVKTADEAARQAVEVLARFPKDVPFAALYLLDEAGRTLRRVASAGLGDADAQPASLALDAAEAMLPWPVARALRTGATCVEQGLAARVPGLPRGPWADPTDAVAVVPIVATGAGATAGALVAGLSACIRPDDRYAGFIELVASQIALAIANAGAYETERRRAEALAEIDRAKTIFFSNVSHELRTPLALMLGPIADALAAQPSAPVRASLEMARRNAQRLLKLVNTLLDFARIEAGRTEASFVPVDLAEFTADLASTFRSAMQRGGLAYHVDCPPLGVPVFVDREMWEKIVLNLLSNAFKFTLEGSVSVRLVREDGFAVLEVADTGGGVAAAEIGRLFERFHRIEGAPSRTHEGSGIGLALVQELVKLHAGTIEATSRPGTGTTLRVRVPLGSAHLPADRVGGAAAPGSAAVGAQAYVQEALRWVPESGVDPGTTAAGGATEGLPGRLDPRFAPTFGARVLVADDNADMRTYLRDLLHPMYQVEAVGDGAAALEAARRAHPDLILSDVMMARLDGFALLRAVRADPALRDVPLILLSARAGEESRLEGLAEGADDYVVKPFGARELLARIGSLLELTRVRRGNEERFRAYVQATSNAVYRMSADWSEMRQLQGRNFIPDQADASTSWLGKFVPAEDHPRVLEAIREAIRTRGAFELEHRVIRADGTPGWTESRAIPLLDKAGNVVEWFGAATDVTERHETQEALDRQQRELQEADRQKNEFLAMLAHELRNPLAPIRNAGELLAKTLTEDVRAVRALATISRQVTHLARLVDDLLDVSRITQGRIELRRRPVRIEEIVAQAVEAVEPMFRQRRQRIAVVSSLEPLVVEGDPERLVQCVGNILANAAKYTPPQGEIRIETHQEGEAAVLTVRDNGMGIASELLPRVFDLFVQGERSLDRAQGGLGIGLALVRRLVQMHDGTVTAASEGTGAGSTFEIRLPLRADVAHSAPVELPAMASPRRILVVDDNQDGAEMLGSLLALDGHTVETVYSGPEALARLGGFRPDVVLLDIGLPGLDGYEVARRIRADPQWSAVQLVAMTGYGQEGDRERSRAAGFAAHLVKPVEYPALQSVIRAGMAAR
jgi:signal transduction histidine kinase